MCTHFLTGLCCRAAASPRIPLCCRSVLSYWKDSEEKISMRRASLQTYGDRKVNIEMLGHRQIMYKNTGPKLHMSISWSLIVFPMLLIKGIPSSLWWGEQCVCKDPEPIKHFLQSWSTDFQHTETLTGKRGYKAPVPGKDKTQVTDVGTIVLSMAFSFLVFCSSAEIEKQAVTDSLLSCSLYLPPKTTQDGIYIRGVSNRPVQSLQSFKS